MHNAAAALRTMWMTFHSFFFFVYRSVPLPLQLSLAAMASELERHQPTDEHKKSNTEQLKQFGVTKKLFDKFHKQDPAKREWVDLLLFRSKIPNPHQHQFISSIDLIQSLLKMYTGNNLNESIHELFVQLLMMQISKSNVWVFSRNARAKKYIRQWIL